MKKSLKKLQLTFLVTIVLASLTVNGQILQWRLATPVYNSTDPDGGGPARGSVTFTLQIHTATGTLPNVTGISTGWSWQSLRAMLPTSGGVLPTCGTNSVAPPGNVVMSSTFAGLGFTFNNVNQCSGTVSFSSDAKLFDRRVAGTVDGGSITLTTTWVDVFTATLWTVDNVNPRGGYALINSGAGGSPGAFSTYAVSDDQANEYVVNSLTYTAPLPLTSPTLPVLISKFDAQCVANKSTSIVWSTSQETNNGYFDVERSVDGINWKSISIVTSTASSSTEKSYQVTDAQGGAAQYRLKQVDKDGRVTYSSTVRTACEGRNVYVTLYPVPAKDLVNLQIGADRAIKTNLQVFDNKGRMVINMPVTLTNGTNNFKIQVQGLAAGEYILKGANPDLEISRRFTVIR